MEVYVLLGSIAYEGDYLLGVYHTKEDAEFACNEYNRKHVLYDNYSIQRRVIGAAAKDQF